MLENAVAKDGTLDSKLLDELYFEALDLSGLVVDFFQLNNKNTMPSLKPPLMGFYTVECNRMTTGIMQAMSWCLMQKGVRSGEVTTEEASKIENRLITINLFENQIDFDTEQFPTNFISYSERARSLHAKIVRLDRIIYDTPQRDGNPVHGLMGQLEEF